MAAGASQDTLTSEPWRPPPSPRARLGSSKGQRLTTWKSVAPGARHWPPLAQRQRHPMGNHSRGQHHHSPWRHHDRPATASNIKNRWFTPIRAATPSESATEQPWYRYHDAPQTQTLKPRQYHPEPRQYLMRSATSPSPLPSADSIFGPSASLCYDPPAAPPARRAPTPPSAHLSTDMPRQFPLSALERGWG